MEKLTVKKADFKLICPGCNHIFHVAQYESGDCPNCKNHYYYWDDDWDYIKEESNFPGYYWESNEKI